MPFDDKRLTTLDPVTIRGYEMKRYHIDQTAQPLTARRRRRGLRSD
jgi:hypothetical protein